MQIVKTVKINAVQYINGERIKMYNKNEIDLQAEREGTALRKQGRYTQSRYQRIRQQTDNYNKQQLDKLFRR